MTKLTEQEVKDRHLDCEEHDKYAISSGVISCARCGLFISLEDKGETIKVFRDKLTPFLIIIKDGSYYLIDG